MVPLIRIQPVTQKMFKVGDLVRHKKDSESMGIIIVQCETAEWGNYFGIFWSKPYRVGIHAKEKYVQNSEKNLILISPR